MSEAAIRIDKWLWHARFFKTRSLATKIVQGGRVRVNGAHVKKPSASVAPGDTLTFPQGRIVRVIEIAAIGARRGPATEAVLLYNDLAPPTAAPKEPDADRDVPPDRGTKPTKRERRQLDALRQRQT